MDNNYIVRTDFLVYDLEMTGLDSEEDEILEIACVPMKGHVINEKMGFFVQLNPDRAIDPESKQVHGLSGHQCNFSDNPMMETVLPQFISHSVGKILVGQSPRLDMDFLQTAARYNAIMLPRFQVIDISKLFFYFFPGSHKWNLDEIAIKFGLRHREGYHNAWDDTILTAKIFSKMVTKLNHRGFSKVSDLLGISRM